MLLSNDKLQFQGIIERASRHFNIAVSYIEKDFYAITILKELVSRDPKFVFKGGTSLSVCQNIINRFSEDIDISYADETITTGTKRKIKQIFFDSIETVLPIGNPDDIRSRRVFNRYKCPYKTINELDDMVIVEWATQTPSFPVEEKTAQTIIGKYLESIGRFDVVQKYNLEAFTTKVLTKERTLVDKVFAICDYHISKKLTRQSRHIYDIYQLLKTVELNDEFISLFLKVKEYRKQQETCYSSKEGMVVSSLLNELIFEKTYLNDYNEKTLPLVYDRIKYEDCVPAIKQIANFLRMNNL